MSLTIITNEKGYSAKEWKDKQSAGGEKHRVYVVGPQGEVGYLNLKDGHFSNSAKTSENFGVVSENEAKITLETNKGGKIYLGDTPTPFDSVDSVKAKERLQEVVGRFGKITECGTGKVEINVGPTVELKMNGRSHWAKANITVAVENPDDVMALYEVVSDMASAMLDLEINRLKNR